MITSKKSCKVVNSLLSYSSICNKPTMSTRGGGDYLPNGNTAIKRKKYRKIQENTQRICEINTNDTIENLCFCMFTNGLIILATVQNNLKRMSRLLKIFLIHYVGYGFICISFCTNNLYVNKGIKSLTEKLLL